MKNTAWYIAQAESLDQTVLDARIVTIQNNQAIGRFIIQRNSDAFCVKMKRFEMAIYDASEATLKFCKLVNSLNFKRHGRIQ